MILYIGMIVILDMLGSILNLFLLNVTIEYSV